MFYLLGAVTGAVIETYLASRLMLWLMRGWNGGYARLLIGNFAALSLTWILAGFGFSHGHGWNPNAGMMYLLPQMIWLVIDSMRLRDNGGQRAA